MITPSQVDRILTIAEHYTKSRALNRISSALIAAGVSIIGIENFFPYLLLVVRPELKTLIDLQNNANTLIALVLIVMGVAVLPVGMIIRYNASRFLSDVMLFELIGKKFPEKFFAYILNEFMTNWALTFSQIDVLDRMVIFIEDQDVIIYDEGMNSLIGEFWESLNNFRMSVAIEGFPLNGGGISIPKDKRTDLIIYDFKQKGEDLKKSYADLHCKLISYRHKSFLKYMI